MDLNRGSDPRIGAGRDPAMRKEVLHVGTVQFTIILSYSCVLKGTHVINCLTLLLKCIESTTITR